jgi:hypothetical protein
MGSTERSCQSYQLLKSMHCHSLKVTGHSLGGALATLTTAYLIYITRFGSRIPESVWRVLSVTYGSPKVGDVSSFGLFVALARQAGKYNCYRLHNLKDPVPSAPPAAMGYHHCFSRVVLSPDGRDYYPTVVDEIQAKNDQTTNAVDNLAAIGPEILGFHDIFAYADATFRFRTRCNNAKAQKFSGKNYMATKFLIVYIFLSLLFFLGSGYVIRMCD